MAATLTLSPRKARKRDRLVARLSPEDKAVIARAAALSGQSVGTFLVTTARKVAEETLASRERIVLSAAESRRFVEALLAPPRPPPKAFTVAMRLYRATVKSDLD